MASETEKTVLKKQRILDAASQVVENQGAGHLTIDAVAATAGISKGGVLYHYPNKQRLLKGMLNRVIANQQRRIEHNRKTMGRAHAHVASVLQPLPKSEWTSSLAILAAAAEDPELLDSARSFMRQVMDDLHEGTGNGSREDPKFAEAMICVLAAEGLRIMDTLNLVPADDKERSLLSSYLMEKAKDATP